MWTLHDHLHVWTIFFVGIVPGFGYGNLFRAPEGLSTRPTTVVISINRLQWFYFGGEQTDSMLGQKGWFPGGFRNYRTVGDSRKVPGKL